jgi:hypothetical protein
MASPRFTGNGFSNPLNPIGLHAENQHRELTPLGADFQIYGAETKVFKSASLVGTGIRATAKNGYKVALAAMKAAGKMSDDAMELAAKQVEGQITKALDDVAAKAVADGATDGGLAAVKKALSKGGLKGVKNSANLKGGSKAFKEAIGEGGEGAVKGSAKDVATKPWKTNMAKFGKGSALVGAQVIVPLGLVYFLNTAGADALADWVANSTGMNCDEKAIDAGYVEGEDDYTEFVTDCQKEGMKMMGMIAAGVVVIGGVILYSFVK